MNPNALPPEVDSTVDHAKLCAALMTAVILGDKKKAKSLIKQGKSIRKASLCCINHLFKSLFE
jgi:hypothetical protein